MNPIVALTVFLWLTNGQTQVVSSVIPPTTTCQDAVDATKKNLDANHVKLGVESAVLECKTQNPPQYSGPVKPDAPTATPRGPNIDHSFGTDEKPDTSI